MSMFAEMKNSPVLQGIKDETWNWFMSDIIDETLYEEGKLTAPTPMAIMRWQYKITAGMAKRNLEKYRGGLSPEQRKNYKMPPELNIVDI